MRKLVIIGSGSTMFTRHILSCIYFHEALSELQVTLEDINPTALRRSVDISRQMLSQAGLPTSLVSGTSDLDSALSDADFVINTIQVGGLEAWELDISIPRRFGVDQEVGDTMGPGGIFRALRHIPPVVSILKTMERVCPDALFINYANPLAPLTWAAAECSNIATIGLCYGVTYTVSQLLGYLGLGPWVNHPYTPEDWERLMYLSIPEDIDVVYGGINHMTWILKLMAAGEDVTSDIGRIVNDPAIYAVDGIRCEIYTHFGYWTTENHWHLSDCLPYFSKNEELTERFLPRRWNLLALAKQIREENAHAVNQQLASGRPFELRENVLNAPKIIHAMCTEEEVRINGNVTNRGLIANLPDGCVVEVPVLVDGSGIHPIEIGNLPPQCAALNRTNINVQELIVEAGLEGNREAAFHAMCLDPLTAAVCTLDEIRSMFDAMLEAQERWLQW